MAAAFELSSLVLDDVEVTGRELGRGAYGVVYEVRVSGLVCAGKKLHDVIIQESTVSKFTEECMCHSQLRHPNIVQLIGIHYPQGSRVPMLIMEYLPLSLTHCLETTPHLLPGIKYSILLDVARGLNYLHNRRPPIIHRDLTANNILLTSCYAAKISDLGVSRMSDSFKQHCFTAAPGNYVVMPPEALEDIPLYDYKLDVFSYGCLVLHVITHQWPRPTAQFVKVPQMDGYHKLVSEWDRRSQYTSQIPSDHPLLDFTKSCLENDPHNRPNMSDAIECVQGIIHSQLESSLEIGNRRSEHILERDDSRISLSSCPDFSTSFEETVTTPSSRPSSMISLDLQDQSHDIIGYCKKLQKSLFDSVKRGNLHKIKQLHQHGAKLTEVDYNGLTSLHHAVRTGRTDIVQYIVNNIPTEAINIQDIERKQTALHKAAWYGYYSICEILVEAGASLSITDYQDNTPYMKSVESEDVKLQEYLLEKLKAQKEKFL